MSSSFEPGKGAAFGSSASTSQHRSGSITNYSASTAASFRPPTSDSASSSSSSSTLSKPWYDSNGIWGSSFTSTSSAARQNPAPRSGLNFGSQNGKQPGKDTIEGKTGSGQLVDSSVSDDYDFRPFYPKRDTFVSQNRSNSNSNGGLPQAFPGASRQSSSFSSSRPTTSGFNPASSANTKPQFASSNLDSPLSYMNDPPPVFTKFERPTKPQASQPTDSAYGDWIDANLTHSPVEDRRRPSVPGYFGGGLPSAPQSRNNSLPPSRHSDIPPTFPARPDAFSASQASSNLLRGSSVSSASRNNGSFGPVDPQTNPLAQFSQMSLQNDNQTLVSQRPSFSGPSYLNHAAAIYNRNGSNDHSDDAEDIDRAAQAPFASDNYTPQSSNDYMSYRGPPYNERSVPNGNTYNPRNGPSNPSFQRQFEPGPGLPTANGFPTVPNPHATAALDQRLRLLAEQQQMNPFFLNMQMLSTAYGHFGGNFYPPYRLPNTVPPHGYPTMPPSMPLAGMPMTDVPKGPRELETGLSLRSALLEEFKNSNKTRRYELKDIYDHVVEFSGDQHGSRFIQQKLETANSDEKERIFREVQPNALQLMMDVFGNYVIQKFFEHGDQNQKKIFANKMKGRVLDLSLQMYGCRVVQQALEHILNDQQSMLVRELERDVLKCVKDQNGNHVIQKAIERCEATDIAFIFQAFAGQVQHLSVHTYGCRVIQRSLEYCKPDTKRAILAELHDCMPTLIGDSFGNYVAQHVVQFGFETDKQRVLELVLKGLEGYSKHKFASNVVEKCLQCSDDAWKREVIEVFARNDRRDGEGMMLGLIRDNYGNYVIQKLLHLLKGDDYTYFVELLLPELVRAKRTGCGKQVLAIEKTLSKPPVDQHLQSQTPFGSRNISQNTTPPPLTADTRSVQTSSVASVNGDALEGAPSSRKGSVQHTEPTVFET